MAKFGAECAECDKGGEPLAPEQAATFCHLTLGLSKITSKTLQVMADGGVIKPCPRHSGERGTGTYRKYHPAELREKLGSA